MSDPQRPASWNNVEIELAGTRVKSVSLNGVILRGLRRASLDLGSRLDGRPACLTVEFIVMDGRIRGQIPVEVVNAPEGSRLVRDHDGRLWIEPIDAPTWLPEPVALDADTTGLAAALGQAEASLERTAAYIRLHPWKAGFRLWWAMQRFRWKRWRKGAG